VEEAVNILYCMIGRAGRKMEHRGKVYKELDHWHDEECQWKKKETKVALKEYKYRDDGEYRETYRECRKEYEKLLETKRKKWQDKKSELINDLITQTDVKRIWEAVRSIVKKRDCNTADVKSI
jgi:vacuolar-type H+-ATPase subunit H